MAATLVKYYKSTTRGFQPGNTYGRLTRGHEGVGSPPKEDLERLWARAVEDVNYMKAYDARVRERMLACAETHRIEAARKLREEAAINAIARSV